MKEKINFIPSIDKNIKAIINKDAIKYNINYLQKKSKTEIMPILKGDAYGHGLIKVSQFLRKIGTKYIGVATLGEAILLRKSGDKENILGWLYNIDGPELIDSFNLDIDVAIFDETTIKKFINKIPDNKKAKVTDFVDTGINRAGISYDKAFEICKKISKCPKIEFVGLMSHLICSEIKNSPIVEEQLRKFRKLRQDLENINIKPPLVHIANTNACLNYDVSDFTLSRSGSGLYGIANDSFPNKNLKLTMSIKSSIIQIKELNKGVGIGYNWKYITSHKISICIIPIGCADIIPQNASSKLYIYINNSKRKVLGLISMDQIVVESKKGDKINDEAYIFGNGDDCPQTIYNLSKITNINPYEILSHIGYRVNRIYK
jgi:alanine racemase